MDVIARLDVVAAQLRGLTELPRRRVQREQQRAMEMLLWTDGM
jgi:hypothetical protein